MSSYQSTPFENLGYSSEETAEKAAAFHALMQKRRSVRDFSDKPVPAEAIKKLIATAASAPSGANKQPWTFCVVERADIKKKIREAAEKEEYLNYHGRMTTDWLDDLAHLGTDEHKPFLEIAPYLIIVFRENYVLQNGEKQKNYYVQESVGLACGFLIAAIHQAGLVTLTHTPSPMNFLQKILDRPANEKPFLLLPVGYPAEGAAVPVIEKKTEKEYLQWF